LYKPNKLIIRILFQESDRGHQVAGIVGTKKFQYDIWGDSVNIAVRMEPEGKVYEVNISPMTYEKLKANSIASTGEKLKQRIKEQLICIL
jgi:class 3 adenylate cyclase